MKRIIKSGPKIALTFKLNEIGIEKTHIALNPNGCVWNIVGSHAKHAELIDEWMEIYCQKKQPATVLPLDFFGNSFSSKVIRKLQDVSFGELTTYKDLAARAGSPNGARAVGNACGKNSFVLIVPCHRVLASGYTLGGFSCGLEIKKELLHFEGHEKFIEN